ncbi:MAG TPA: hypothetical protein VNO52_18945 [Methylomirabilota bacterium]|nr:hypothetical protein [Methylomirabilota bacterium]
MHSTRHTVRHAPGLLLLFLVCHGVAAQIPEVQLRGRMVCLIEELHRLHGAELPARHEHHYGFKTEDGRLFTLLRGTYSEALFADARLREKDLLLKARLFPGTQILEVLRIRSVRAGVVQDLYYYCDICAIRSVAPGVCDCCQAPMELVEKPE